MVCISEKMALNFPYEKLVSRPGESNMIGVKKPVF
jgi:hypothetical protein